MNRTVEHRGITRARILLALAIAGWLLIEGRLAQIQLLESRDLSRDVVVSRTEYLAAQRGPIYDRHGLPLAVSMLAAQSEHDLAARGPYRREYPMGSAAGGVTGIVGRTPYGFTGREGVEFQYDQLLSGVDGSVSYIISGSGQFCTFEPLRINKLPEPGSSVFLTVDAVYQALAQLEAESLRTAWDARWAGILLMRPQTSEILAAAVAPSADPEHFEPGSSTSNALWTRQFEPGSSFKIVVLAAALEHGLVSPDSPVDCENGTWVTPARVWRDTKPLGIVPLKSAVARSSNIAAAKLGIALGVEGFLDYVRLLGFGEKSSPHLNAEASGFVPALRSSHLSSLAALAMGQGMSVTGVQLLNAFCCIANEGRLMQPLLASGTDGIQPTLVRQAIRPATAHTITQLLEGVVREGTGTGAHHPLLRVAGKTGTAQVAGRGGVGYLEGTYIATFAGFFPADQPVAAMLVVVAGPQGGHYGGHVCAPAFRRVMDLILAAPGGCLYPECAAMLSAAPRSGWVSATPEVGRG